MRKALEVSGLVDCHNHTNFSYDAQQSAQELFNDARILGLGGVCITEHVDLHLFDGYVHEQGVCRFKRAELYESALHECVPNFKHWLQRRDEQRKAEGEFLQLFGMELGYHPSLVPELCALIQDMPLDEVIGSVHVIDGKDLGVIRERLYAQEKEAVYRDYLRRACDLVRAMPQIDILAHIDYIARYPRSYQDARMYGKDYQEELKTLFSLLIEADIALELNTGSAVTALRRKFPQFTLEDMELYLEEHSLEPYALDADILLLYKDMGGKLLTLDSDSHKNGYVAGLFNAHIAYLRELGFSELHYFVERELRSVSLV